MSGPTDPAHRRPSGPSGRPGRPSRAEERARRAAIDDPEVILVAALRILERRARSTADLRGRLVSAGYQAVHVDGIVARLESVGLLDDARYARDWVAARDRYRPRGERALRQELGLRGVSGPMIDDVLAARRSAGADPDLGGEFGGQPTGRDAPWIAIDAAGTDARPPGEPDLEGARRLIARRRADLDRIPDLRRRRDRAYVLLARRGFSSEIAARVAREAVAADADSDEPDVIDPGPDDLDGSGADSPV